MEKPEIKVGQIWVTRGGKTIVIDLIDDQNGIYPVRSGDLYWQSNGRYWSDSFDDTKDLIKLFIA